MGGRMTGVLTVDTVPIERLIPYARNPRQNEAAVAKVAASIREFGWRQPIVVDEEMTVIAGHTRLLAARQLGMAEVPVHIARGLTPTQIKAYRLADNRVAQEATWDDAMLGLELADLSLGGFDLALTGFDDIELHSLLEGPTLVREESPDVDLAPPTKAKSKTGELYPLGRHRLLCGDARSATDLARLMDGAVAEVLWTDPPYGVDYAGKTEDALTIQNDGAEGLPALLEKTFTNARTAMAPNARFYCAAPAGPRHVDFWIALQAAGLRVHQELQWVKDVFVLGHSDYHYRHEPILYGFNTGEGRPGRGAHEGTRWYGDHAQDSVFEVARPKISRDHPTTKPTELVLRCLKNSARRGDIVLDLFAGSGTTLIACQQYGCDARLLEIDPRYCDVIRRRYAELVGKPELAP